MIDLSDVTFTIPVRIDSRERLENFITVSFYLLEKFNARIIILEDDDEQKISFDKPPARLTYIFRKTADPLFHKTKLINQLCMEASTPIVALCDCDVLFEDEQYERAAALIREGLCDLCLPSDGDVVEIESVFARNLLKDFSVKSLPTCNIVGNKAVGGCLFYNKASFIRGGMANENIKSYGWEDQEIILRFGRLGFRIERVKGRLYHLKHPRGMNSLRSHSAYEQNRLEFSKVSGMNMDELREYVASWNWIKS